MLTPSPYNIHISQVSDNIYVNKTFPRLCAHFKTAKMLRRTVKKKKRILGYVHCFSLLKRNIWIFKSGDWIFYLFPGHEILKFFPCKLHNREVNESSNPRIWKFKDFFFQCYKRAFLQCKAVSVLSFNLRPALLNLSCKFKYSSRYLRVAVISAKNQKRQRRKHQSVTAKREKSQTPKFLTATLILPNLT